MSLASFLNYVNSGIPNDNIANEMTFPVCNPATTTCTNDFPCPLATEPTICK